MDLDITQLYRGLPELGGRGRTSPRYCRRPSDIRLTRHHVETPAEAERTRFHGSPSPLLDGVDAFAEPCSEVGVSCRRYLTPDGYGGGPTLEQLWAVLADA